uniref:Uncharacterized protein n=1 Tax=Utricularia reniformis TaxID=192314 RepID=A0A1Y0B2G6_9LAMI|nr:hypothetical protein AEK19_MT1450 [Utricularia reniformis]ART31642.1 hypothetical protein AEK19_MT1450 [Utricularia reniformis]
MHRAPSSRSCSVQVLHGIGAMSKNSPQHAWHVDFREKKHL